MNNRILIVGGGFAGYNAALSLSAGNEVTLVEKDELGGTCLNRGCIPTKLFLHLASKEKSLKRIQEKARESISKLGSGMKYLLDTKKITYLNDEAEITSKNRILLKKTGKSVDFDMLVLSVGSEPAILENFEKTEEMFTSDDILNLDEVPKRLAIIGGGYIGVEFACIFNMLGAEVTIIEKEKTILPSIDADAAYLLTKSMEKKGVRILSGKNVDKIENSAVCIGGGEEIPYDKIMFCTGRKSKRIKSNIPIELENGRIKTDDFFRTSHENVAAIGDCTEGPMLANKAAYDARLFSENFYNREKQKKDYSKIPFCIFTEPAIAGIGELGGFETIKVPFGSIGKAYCDDSTEGFLKLAIDKDKKICGGLIVNKNALEVLSALTVIVEKGLTCGEVSKLSFAHPSSGEILGEAAKRALR